MKCGLLFLIFFALNVTFATSILAVECVRPVSGDVTISSSCTFNATVEGSDSASSATSTSNTATLAVNNNATLTINAGQTVVWGNQVTIAGGGSIAVNSTGQLKQTNLWFTDTDNDGAPDTLDYLAQSNQPTNGKRRAFQSTTTADCSTNDVNTWQNLTCYQDADGDGWTVGSPSTACRGASCPAGWRTTSSGTDCSDSSASYTSSCPFCLGKAYGTDCGGYWETGCNYQAPYWHTQVYHKRCDGNVTCFDYCYEHRLYWNACKSGPYTGYFDTCG